MTYNIALVSDFFLPNLGGVEVHILNLGKNLIKRGHKVIVVTHSQNIEPGIKFLYGIKVYYLPISIMVGVCSWPSFFSNFFQLQRVFYMEEIEIIHGHQSVSPLAYEAMLIGQIFNIKTVFTDHSLFVTNNLENIIVNRISKFVLSNVNRIICVSYELKTNLLERTEINHKKIHVIPNGVSKKFKYLKKSKSDFIKIVVCCRLVYRKGVDLLLKAIPLICKSNKKIKIILVGDGPKRDEIDQMVDDTGSNVKVIRNLSQKRLNKLFNRCDIFLNTSLTESFCIANLEAACCGLRVVCTNVGGVKEVLPPSMIKLVKPHYKSIAKGVIQMVKKERILKCHAKTIRSNYSWKKVSKDVEFIYKNIQNRNKRFGRLFNNTGEDEKWLFRMILLIMLFLKVIWVKYFKKKYKKEIENEKCVI